MHDGFAVGGRIIAHILNKPAVGLNTTMAYSRRALLMYPSLTKQFLKNALTNYAELLAAWQNYSFLAKRYDIKIKGLGDMIMNKEQLNIVFLTRFFQPFSQYFDKSFHFVGPSIYPRMENSAFINTLSKRKKIIYISYGTFINDDISLYKLCIEAFRNLDYQVVISLGNRFDPSLFFDVPQNIVVKKYVNQLEVLQHASLFISHAGMNGVSESLYYGVPMILIPTTEEQRFNSLLVQKTGAGILLDKNDVTKELLLSTVNKVLENQKFANNAKKQQEIFQSSGGYKKAADEIEKFLTRLEKVD